MDTVFYGLNQLKITRLTPIAAGVGGGGGGEICQTKLPLPNFLFDKCFLFLTCYCQIILNLIIQK